MDARGVYIRHDVDYSFQRAYRMAMLEEKNDVQSTYMIQLHSPFYNPLTQDNLTKLKEMAEFHTIGLHYDTRCTPNTKMVQEEGRYLTEMLDCPVELFSAHDWILKDRRIDIPGDMMRMEGKYISDSGGIWREGCFCKHVGKWEKLQVLIHPEWWWHESQSPQENLDQIFKLNAEDLLASHKYLNAYLQRYYERRKAEFHKQAKKGEGTGRGN